MFRVNTTFEESLESIAFPQNLQKAPQKIRKLHLEDRRSEAKLNKYILAYVFSTWLNE